MQCSPAAPVVFNTASMLRVLLLVCALAAAPGWARDIRTGVACDTGAAVRYDVVGGYGVIEDIIIGTEAELAAGCITLPRGLAVDDLPAGDATNGDRPAAKEAMAAFASRWPGGNVPYVIDASLDAGWRPLLDQVRTFFADYTNVRLVPRTTEASYVTFRAETSGSYCGLSNIGFLNTSTQDILLGAGGCRAAGVAMHEILHALGMLHEHARPDRDRYVKVGTCVQSQPDFVGAFAIGQTTPFGAYDYASVMHYARDSVCAGDLAPWDGHNVYAPRSLRIPIAHCDYDPRGVVVGGYVVDIGQRCTLSDGDLAALNYFYPSLLRYPTSAAAEFYNTGLNHYFVTINTTEMANIDLGGEGPGWQRTGQLFNAYLSAAAAPAGASPVCRFYGTPGLGPNSHFYTAVPSECEMVKRDPGWTFEGIVFYMLLPTGGKCAGSAIPVYRAYNNRYVFNDSNHRYSTSLATIQQMAAAGWTNEGVVMCAPFQ